MNNQRGFSVVEVLLATAIFLIFAGGTILTVLQVLQQNRQGIERVIATQYASHGLEAVRSIRNQQYSILADSASTGITKSASVWAFSGVNNQFGKFTRVISVATVSRDGNGVIVTSGGTPDANTKKITSTVTWNSSPTQNNSVTLTTYLTNWRVVTNPPPSPVPSPTPVPTNCQEYCVSLQIYTSGTCRKGANQCTNNGETHQPGGNAYCTNTGSSNTCCCK